ncbi:hypothetical protein [Parabacteroides sp. AM08-6]|uniref:hypothetical protein n=1 Tax=Parabacteroides sp. AM08-6 TaxID=2292053 RepID=UPI000EFF47F4|nr:hypothetical protein [Parabacteroides sp. AM08-6]RHJ82385.1 hypothetical protein DW103_10245 [Parabacteroides sp. AM08-6]
MANKDKIDYLLLDIRELETLIAGMRNAEIYPVSFFGQTFNLTHKILKELHTLETEQIDMLRKQMEEHQAMIQSMPGRVATPMPEIPKEKEVIQVPVPEKKEVVVAAKEETIPAPEKTTEAPIPPIQEEATPVIPEKPVAEPIIEVHPKPEQKSEPERKPEPEIIPEATAKSAANEKTGLFLNDILEKKNLSDFRKAFSLNDRFRFRRELFGGDEGRMNKAINDLNNIHSYEDSITYLNNELKWNIEDEAVADFIKLLEKRFL